MSPVIADAIKEESGIVSAESLEKTSQHRLWSILKS